MTGFDEAIALIGARVTPLGVEEIALDAAAGRVLAVPLHARSDTPRRATAAMDGYAVRDAATRPGVAQTVIGESRAGAGYPGAMGVGEAVRIFTGAPMPAGADRCIMQEYADRDGDTVRFRAGYGPGRHVRAAASEFAAGAELLSAGTLLGPRALVAAAAADVATVTVHARPRVAILGTGDELAPPGSAHLHPDAIPESVTLGVAALATAAGAVVVARTSEGDDPARLTAVCGALLASADVLVVTGGASVGDHDHARAMLVPHGLDLIIDKVAMKPGKPVWFGRAGGRHVIGLPGNPTSAMVTAHLFLRPLLAVLRGQAVGDVLRWRRLPLAQPLRGAGDRDSFVGARWDEDGLTPVPARDSGAQAALAAADWLILHRAHAPDVPAGAEVIATRF